MSNQESTKAWRQQAKEAVTNLQMAIKTAPMGEIRAVFEGDLGFSAQWGRQNLRDCVDDLMNRAALADPRAIRELFYIHATMTAMLAQLGLADSTRTKSEDGMPKEEQKTPAANTGNTDTWREEVNRAANALCQTVELNPEALEGELQNALGKLPPALFSFPLDRLFGAAEPSDNCTRLVSDLCDRLIQLRLRTECKRVIDGLAEDSAERPPIPPGLGAVPRTDEGPTDLTRQIYFHLEHERTRFRTPEERKKLRKELKRMCSARKLLDQIADQRKQQEREARNEPKQNLKIESRPEISADMKSASDVTTLRKIDEEIADTMQINDEAGSKIIVIRVEVYEEERLTYHLPHNIFQKKKLFETLPRTLEMHRIWATRAALLPPLSKKRKVIEKWVDAALFWIISLDRGPLEEISWTHSIMRRINRTQSVLAGIRLFLREGFETLAGKDQVE